MGHFDFFKQNKKSKTEIVKIKRPSLEQAAFASAALEIIGPTIEKSGFKRHITEVDTHITSITYRNDNRYIKIQASNYPTDYPFFYTVMLGEGNSKDFFEFDWNSIPLWRLKQAIEQNVNANEYDFPFGDKITYSLTNANVELVKYADTFLKGDLILFYEVRKKQNQDKEPYKVHFPDSNGIYITTDDPKSVEQKKKYSQ